ncbi:MAG: type II secretion system minor pseudopilin GspK [Marinobacterium sp.]|nr:type II secretion system minor pseudopilin GspK [Marinobacterium sp.]
MKSQAGREPTESKRTGKIQIAAKQSGVALIMVLAILATISLLAVEINGRMQFSTQRTLNRESQEQAHWYAHGGAQLAKQQIDSALQQGPSAVMKLVNGDQQRYPVGPVGSKDEIRLQIRSGHNCFNLNSLAPSIRQAENLQSFNSLLSAFNINEAERQLLSDRLLDWLDPDNQRRPQGAENSDYLDLHSYSADNTLTTLAILPQLWPEHLGPDASPAHYKKLQPLLEQLCALPGYTGLSINIDHLQPEQAVLINAASHGRISVSQAQTLLAGRPTNGYQRPDRLMEQPLMKALELTTAQLNSLRFESLFFRADVYSLFQHSHHRQQLLIQQQNDQAVVIRTDRASFP